MKLKVHLLLLALCAIVLLTIAVKSVRGPLRFEQEVARREQAVTTNIRTILEAEEVYKQDHGRYTSSLGDLIGGGYISDSLCVIPHSSGQLFNVSTSIEKDGAGATIQRITCAAFYRQFLEDLDPNQTEQLIETTTDEDQFPGVEMSLTHILTQP